MTAALGLFEKLDLPLPGKPATTPTPLIVYGGASAVGAYAIKLATLSNIHPIVSVAGNGIPYVESLLDKSKGDTVIDYRKGNDHVVEELRKAAGTDVIYALDAVSEKGSVGNLGKVLAEGGRIATVLTPEMANAAKEDAGKADVLFTLVGTIHAGAPPGAKFGDREFGTVFYPFLGLGLAEGWFQGHPYEVIEGGLDGLQKAIGLLQDGKLSAKKAVFRIAETSSIVKS